MKAFLINNKFEPSVKIKKMEQLMLNLRLDGPKSEVELVLVLSENAIA
jgi:hypothetical protein